MILDNENTRVKDNNIKATSGAMESAWSDWFDREMLNSARLLREMNKSDCSYKNIFF